MNAAYCYLAIAICSEVIATVSMKAIKGWSTPIPLLLVIVGYGIAFWMLTLVVRTVPVGVAYAVWAGMGIVMVSIAALFIYGQKLDIPAMLGMGLIVLGVVVIQLFSKTAGHCPPLNSLYTAPLVLNIEVADAIRYFHRRSDCRRRGCRPLAQCAPAPPGVFHGTGGKRDPGWRAKR